MSRRFTNDFEQKIFILLENLQQTIIAKSQGPPDGLQRCAMNNWEGEKWKLGLY